jgi:hypothetical protein
MAALTAVLTLADMLAFVLVDRRPGEAQCRLPELYILTAQPALLSPKAPTLPSPSPQRSWTLIVTVQQCSFVSQSASSASSNRPKARAVKGQLLSRCNSVEAGCGPSRAAPKFPPRRRLRDAAPPFFSSSWRYQGIGRQTAALPLSSLLRAHDHFPANRIPFPSSQPYMAPYSRRTAKGKRPLQ